MNHLSGYIVSINAPEGLQEPCGESHKDIGLRNREAITGNFDAKLEQLNVAGVLDGITMHMKMRYISCLHVDGPEENIRRLKEYLVGNGIGTLIENCEMKFVE